MKLTPIQARKLRLAAEMLKTTAPLYSPAAPTLLPLWGGGIITHGQPKSTALVIGISRAAQTAPKGTTAHDHLYRVTQTAETILMTIKENPGISIAEIEQMLLDRAVYMVVTKSENNRLKNIAKSAGCKAGDVFQLYHLAKISYELFAPIVVYSKASRTAYVPIIKDSPAFWTTIEGWTLGQIPGIGKIIFKFAPNGIPIPQSFLDFCKKHGIDVMLEKPETFDDQLAGEREVSITKVLDDPAETEPAEED